MAHKVILDDIVNLQNETSATNKINENSRRLEAALENTLSRDGSGPNAMHTSLDMNSNRVINLPVPSSGNEAATKNYVDEVVPSVSESGSWTPILTFETPGDLSVTYSGQKGVYFKIGSLVIAWFEIITSTFTHSTASGNLQISGFPFINDGATTNADTRWGGVTKANYTDISAVMAVGATLVTFQAYGSGQTPSNVVVADVPSGGIPGFRATLIYLTDE